VCTSSRIPDPGQQLLQLLMCVLSLLLVLPLCVLVGLSEDTSISAAFMAMWTLKEAAVKARGSGINSPPGLRGVTIGT